MKKTATIGMTGLQLLGVINDNDSELYNKGTNPEPVFNKGELSILQMPDPFLSANVYSLYDALVAAYPTYITKVDLGTETSGKHIYGYKFYPVQPSNDEPTALPKYFIMSGTHPEMTGVLALYNTMKAICVDWSSNYLLEYLRFNINFIIVPMVNPYGCDTAGHNNYNGVDIANNFPTGWQQGVPGNTYGGTAPLSEIESQIINQIMVDNTDITGVIDFHNFSGDYDNAFIWTIPPNKYMKNVSCVLFKRMTRKWRKEYDFIAAKSLDWSAGYTQQGPGGCASEHANFLGFKASTVFEVNYRVFADPTSVPHDTNDTTFAFESFVNFLLILDADLKNRNYTI